MTDLAHLVRHGRPIRVTDALGATDAALHDLTRARGLVLDALDSAIADLTAARANIGEAITRAHADSDDGFKPNSLGGGTPTTVLDNEGTPVALADFAVGERVAVALEANRPDMIRRRATTMLAALARAQAAARVTITGVRDLLPLPQHEALQLRAKELGTAVVQCANPNCHRDVVVGGGRLKAGRCLNCYRYRQSHYGVERPKALCDAEIERELAMTKAEKRAAKKAAAG